MSAASRVHLKWALEKEPGKEHVTFGNFVRHFNLADRQSASDAFTLLVESTEISRDRQQRLWEAYKYFCEHHAERFWAERSLQINSEVSAKQAGALSQNVGVKQSEIGYRKYFSSIGASDESLDIPAATQASDHTSCSLPGPSNSPITLDPVPVTSVSPTKKRKATCTTEDPWHDLTVCLTELVTDIAFADMRICGHADGRHAWHVGYAVMQIRVAKRPTPSTTTWDTNLSLAHLTFHYTNDPPFGLPISIIR
ncbi:hypothetical protein B0O80DRAFT_133731 [Mortierella sp. GBAus27b]|nr:hypothetical protein B0O80DRAFT_133731 [Mortierella sp. GBAus27b]